MKIGLVLLNLSSSRTDNQTFFVADLAFLGDHKMLPLIRDSNSTNYNRTSDIIRPSYFVQVKKCWFAIDLTKFLLFSSPQILCVIYVRPPNTVGCQINYSVQRQPIAEMLIDKSRLSNAKDPVT